MERIIERVKTVKDDLSVIRRSSPDINRACILWGAAGAIVFFVLAMTSLSLFRFDSMLASVWVPNAAAVACLLRARPSNEIPFYTFVFFAGILANFLSGTPLATAAIYSVANIADIAIVVFLTRRGSGLRPDMSHLPDLGRFIWVGGLIGPATSALISSTAMLVDDQAGGLGAIAWLITDAMGMVLIVPTALLAFDAWQERNARPAGNWLERLSLLAGGVACVFLVFKQDAYPLLFLIPPITLLHAFRLGSLGTGLCVVGLAFVASFMTWAGTGPIYAAGLSLASQVHMLQSFIAANFLTGLPVAAILAGQQRIMIDLETGKRQIDLLADNITDAVLRFDTDGRCTYASPSVRDVLDEEPETFIGRFPTDRMHDDARETISLAQNRLTSGQSDKERFTYRRFLDAADGTAVFIEADCALARNPATGEHEGIVVSARDVTERVELEMLLTRARRAAENAANAKSEFLANMSHEIRTPMNGVLGFAELMLQGDLDEDQRRQTEMIVQSGRSMMLLLNDILDLSKVEAGQISIDRGSIDLHATLSDCVALQRPNAEKKGLKLRFERELHDNEASDPDSNWVITDGLRLRQIVLNLVGNAVKFTETGLIHVSYRVDQDQISIRVMDTGIGISESRIDSVFLPFTQGESDTARRFGGTGLGLTISRQLTELLGGFIELESKPGVGSSFTLTLPAPRGTPDREPSGELSGSDTLNIFSEMPHHARILLAEDHDVNRMLATEMLERCGQSVAIAHDGNEAISMVIDSMMRGAPYDLVLMDIQMPGCDGYAATRTIRAEGILPDLLPIIALTANAFPEDIAAARAAGMQGHLSKPLVFADLARALQRWLPTRIIENEFEPDASHARSAGQTAQAPSASPAHAAPEAEPHDIADANDDHSAFVNKRRQSPMLVRRWLERRGEAVEAVRAAALTGSLTGEDMNKHERETLARTVHKLAGTAAMFGEEELGTQASALERALRTKVSGTIQNALADKLLELADRDQSEGQELREA
ncbi:response regulator [Erythrobacter insulae]|uniref:Sensory/regulatory protein RpfC n=1 Tax=Erythrobacter insulae TaxID=2584124 RepID=A0A547PA20_9SPHN|nr:ATP-binding protein [Erythrobacter insulae]TRD10976.1 response regulator [Erythrobacter insulae]